MEKQGVEAEFPCLWCFAFGEKLVIESWIHVLFQNLENWASRPWTSSVSADDRMPHGIVLCAAHRSVSHEPLLDAALPFNAYINITTWKTH